MEKGLESILQILVNINTILEDKEVKQDNKTEESN